MLWPIACLLWPLVESYPLTAYSRAGANVTYDFGEDLEAGVRTLHIDFRVVELNDQLMLDFQQNFDANEPFRRGLTIKNTQQ